MPVPPSSFTAPHQYTLWAVHLVPSGVPATHTLIPLPYIPPLRHCPGRPFRAVRSTIAAHHPNLPKPILPPCHAPGRPFRAVRSVCHRPLPAALQNPPHLSLTRGRPFGAVLSDNHLHLHHPSYLTQSHHLPHFIALPVPLPFPFYPHSTPFPPLFQVVLGRPFRAVRSTINLIIILKLTPTLVNHAHGSSLHNIHHLSSLWAVDQGRQEQHYQSQFSFPYPLPLSEWVKTVQVGPSEAQPATTVGGKKKKKTFIASPRPLPPPPVFEANARGNSLRMTAGYMG